MNSDRDPTSKSPARGFDLLHLHDRILGGVFAVYFISVGGTLMWRQLTGLDPFNPRLVLLGFFLTLFLGPAAVIWFAFRSSSRARAVPIGLVKRIVGGSAGLFVAIAGLCVMWMSIADARAGPDWNMFLGASSLVVAGAYGVYCCGLRGVDVV